MNKELLLKLMIILVFLMIVLPSVVLAQDTQTEWLTAILNIFLGTLPGACSTDLAQPLCTQCIGFMKIIPLTFFVAIFYLVFYTIIRNLDKERKGGPTEMKIAAIIAVILAIVFVHAPQVQSGLQSIMLWLSLAFVFLAIITIAGAVRGLPAIIAIIVALIIIAVLWGYFWGSFGGIVESWQEMCIG